MPSIKSILTDIQTLPLNQVEELLSYLEEFLVSKHSLLNIYVLMIILYYKILLLSMVLLNNTT